MVQRLARSPFKLILVTPDKGLAAFSITYSRLEWVGEGWNGIPSMQFSMQFCVDRGPGLFGAMRLSRARLDGTGRRLQTQKPASAHHSNVLTGIHANTRLISQTEMESLGLAHDCSLLLIERLQIS